MLAMSFGARSDKGEMIPSLEMRFTCQPLEQTKALDGGMDGGEIERERPSFSDADGPQ